MKEFFTSHETRFIINREIRREFYELYEEENHYSICNVCLGNVYSGEHRLWHGK